MAEAVRTAFRAILDLSAPGLRRGLGWLLMRGFISFLLGFNLFAW
jgi:hypothetical protein